LSDEVTIVACGQCKRNLDEPSNTPENKRNPCPNCGSVSRLVKKEIADSISVRDGVRGKARSGEAGKPGGKPWLTTMSEPSWSHSAQKWMHREKTENRRENRYTEVVKDPETGEVVHEVEEPLSEHRGHGSAKKGKRKGT
jgi:DNA-directed RNA polymerase subunit RPC12/RpoP